MNRFETEKFPRKIVGEAEFDAIVSKSVELSEGEIDMTPICSLPGGHITSFEWEGGHNQVDWECIVKVTNRPEDNFVTVKRNLSHLSSARVVALVSDCGRSSFHLIASFVGT